ncbi:dimethylarginine dimethylaminohydrolase family protein [Marininema halotolerans]|uniref:N-Dimethylarginine dimethylaminohydrolase n=1 Tax=Marininema halotolerans TaxID=1155944 RepID=A0A1I6PYA7_9BACL|nr:dimethylarginine dimethylaminohydrolase family protein [Marininema halotolerans]SFS45098.1 N-Dimethylarginine dimethylaminohydrolase [Marininema halotolerans]
MITDIQPSATCWSEYAPLRRVLLCPPQFMRIDEVINHVQTRYIEDGIDTQLALEQHQELIATLQRYHVDVILLEPDRDYPDQVFTRDIGFTIGNHLFVSQMEESIRKGEEQILTRWLTDQQIPYQFIRSGSIEGGDVMIDRDTVWIGDSGRTSRRAMAEIQQELPHMEVLPLSVPVKYLHLDCILNILSPTEALIFPSAFEEEDLQRLASRYELIEVDETEQFTLGTNILSIGNRTILSLPVNPRVNEALRQRGYTVVEVDLSEIIKSGGSFRCSTLPLIRGEE